MIGKTIGERTQGGTIGKTIVKEVRLIKTLTVKITVEIPEEIALRFAIGRRLVRVDNYIANYSDAKQEVVKAITEIAEQFGS